MDPPGEPVISTRKRPCQKIQNGSEFPELGAQNSRNPQQEAPLSILIPQSVLKRSYETADGSEHPCAIKSACPESQNGGCSSSISVVSLRRCRSLSRNRGILRQGGAIQRRPSSQRVHVVSPMHDLSFLNRYDRDEPVVIGHARRKNLAVNFVFEDHDTTVLRAVHNKCVAGVKLDRLAVSGEASDQIGSTSNRQRPTGEVIAEFKECVIGNCVEIMFAINESA